MKHIYNMIDQSKWSAAEQHIHKDSQIARPATADV
jgi:hypothetical protein